MRRRGEEGGCAESGRNGVTTQEFITVSESGGACMDSKGGCLGIPFEEWV